MKAVTTLLSVFLTMAMGAMAATIAKLITDDFSFNNWAFVVFFISLRIKIYLNDLSLCYEADRTSFEFKRDFLVGMVVWFMWIVSAIVLSNSFFVACLLLAIAIFIATVLLQISKTANTEKKFWIKINIAYIILIILSGSLSWVNEYVSILSMLIAIALVMYDYWYQTPFKVFEEQDC
jgi:hypothetical protein